jgi:hypothetical protein
MTTPTDLVFKIYDCCSTRRDVGDARQFVILEPSGNAITYILKYGAIPTIERAKAMDKLIRDMLQNNSYTCTNTIKISVGNVNSLKSSYLLDSSHIKGIIKVKNEPSDDDDDDDDRVVRRSWLRRKLKFFNIGCSRKYNTNKPLFFLYVLMIIMVMVLVGLLVYSVLVSSDDVRPFR